MCKAVGTVLLAILAISLSSLYAGEAPWYEHPREHLTIIHDTASQEVQDTLVDDGDTMYCSIAVFAVAPLVAAGPSQAVVDSLSEFISNFVTQHFDLSPGATLRERVARELDSFHTAWRELSGEGLVGIHQEAVVEYCDHGILSLKYVDDNCISCNGFPYSEGSWHYALPSLSAIPESSLFTEDSRAYLDSIGEVAFRKDRHIPPDVPLSDSGFHFEDDGRFSLGPDFIISDSGVTYVFNAYEIASGAYGMSYAYLTWDQLRPIINPTGPLAWVLKPCPPPKAKAAGVGLQRLGC